MLAIIRNLNQIDTTKLQSLLKDIGIENIYIQKDANTSEENNFLRQNSQHRFCLLIDASISKITIKQDLPDDFDVVGGLILSHTSEPMWNNYGMETNMVQEAYAEALKKLALNFWSKKEIMQYVKNNINYSPDFNPPQKQEVDWVSELFMFVKTQTLIDIGGLDSKLSHFHIGPDICKRVRQNSGKVLFDPSLQATLGEPIPVAKKKKENHLLEDTIYFYQKHYGIDRETFMKHFYLKEYFEY